jgi:hypothetical protein
MRCCASRARAVRSLLEKHQDAPRRAAPYGEQMVGCAAAHQDQKRCALRAAPYGKWMVGCAAAHQGQVRCALRAAPYGEWMVGCAAAHRGQEWFALRAASYGERMVGWAAAHQGQERCALRAAPYGESRAMRSLLEDHQDPGKARIMLRDEQHPTGKSRAMRSLNGSLPLSLQILVMLLVVFLRGSENV